MKPVALAFSILVLTSLGLAQHQHGGHMASSQKTADAGATPSPHGGVVKTGKHLSLELMTMKMGLAIFPMTKDGKEIPISEVVLAGKVLAPKEKSAPMPVEFSGMGNHFMANFERKGDSPLELHVTAKSGGKSETFVFPLSP